MGGGAGKQAQYKVQEEPTGPPVDNRPVAATASYGSHEQRVDDGFGYGPPVRAAGPSSSPNVKRNVDFNARIENVIDWESISGPALRHAVPMLAELESEQKCDAWLWRPMHYAAIYGASEAVEALARCGAYVDARTGGHGLTGKPLNRATFNFSALLECVGPTGAREQVKALEVNGDCITVVHPHTRSKKSVDLESCVCTGYATGQQPNHVRRFGFATALHIAIEFQHIDTIRALLGARANPNNSWNEHRDTPLHTAVAQGNDEAVDALLTAKADPNAEDSWGRMPLIVAAVCAKQPTWQMAVLLLDANARQGATDRSGKTAAQLAREAGHAEFADAVEHYDINERADVKAARMVEMERLRREQEEQKQRESEQRAQQEAIDAARRQAEEAMRREAEEKRRQEELENARKESEEAAARAAEAVERARKEAEEKEAAERAEKEREEEEKQKEAEEQDRREKERQEQEAAEEARRQAEEKAKQEAEQKAEEKARQEAEEKARKEAEEEEEERAKREAEEKARQEAEEKARQEAEEKARQEAEEKARQEAEEKARQEAEEKAKREEEERLRLEEEEAKKKSGEGQQQLHLRWLVALARVSAVATLSKRREAWHREFAKVRSDRWDRAIAKPPLDATTGRMIASSGRADLLREGGLIKEANKLEAELRKKKVDMERLHAKWGRMAELSKLSPEEATTILLNEFGYDD